MLIDYYLADGQRIIHETAHSWVTMEDINALALIYAERCPDTLPTDVFMSLSVYGSLIRSLSNAGGTVPVNSGYHVVQVWTSAGCLKVHPMPLAFKGFEVLVGRIEDYNVYDVDKIFEDIVLNECEREE
jgi:hypothetical protein